MEHFKSYFDKIKHQLTSKEDCLVIFFHYLAIRSGLYCAGIGENWTSISKNTTDIPPEGWNANQQLYFFRYTDHQQQQFQLKIVNNIEYKFLFVYWINFGNSYSCGTLVKIEDHVGENLTTVEEAFKTPMEVLKELFCRMINDSRQYQQTLAGATSRNVVDEIPGSSCSAATGAIPKTFAR
ncbi:uncharacterized protein LOC111614850 [Centruroides sculpturatus]|uniref:uncharacterized protein LOC111614850 n=1 Tax=Centruroides sculpturatus TaxID=218467 RepID=UPI000C6E4702|nr:uncharacterized protein LOC111614850 [Centruroides sculpturatus]